MKTKRMYRVYFIDVKDLMMNCKLLEANCVEDIRKYMLKLGHGIVSVEEA